MASIPHRELSETPRIAIYARVSTEDQAERQTVQAQVEFLRRFCGLYDWPVVGEYVDDGWSGTIPLADREYGRQMLDELPTTQPTKILVYRLDRLGRSVRVLLDAHTTLEDKGIAIQSATEPFDTSTPIGRFVFQLLGSIAELERSTITERMALGRDRVARQGKWTGGPIPYGYDLDADSCLVPSVRLVEPTDQTEAQVAREVFERIAAGSSAVREAKRLQALGVPCFRRWAGGKELVTSGVWHADRIAHMIRNSSYKGTHVMQTKAGPVERPTVALVAADTWERANAQLGRNRLLATRNAKHPYLLRGLLRCAGCGKSYVGTHGWIRRNVSGRWYRCNGQVSSRDVIRYGHRCPGKAVRADALEADVWAGCREFILHPGPALAEAQEQLRARLEQTTDLEPRRQALQQQLRAKEAEREPVLTLLRRGRVTMAEAEAQLDAIAQETADLRQMLDALGAQAALTAAAETHLTNAAALLARLQGNLADIEASDDWARKREVVECLVAGIVIQTEGPLYHRQTTARVRYAFPAPSSVVVTDTACRCARTVADRRAPV